MSVAIRDEPPLLTIPTASSELQSSSILTIYQEAAIQHTTEPRPAPHTNLQLQLPANPAHEYLQLRPTRISLTINLDILLRNYKPTVPQHRWNYPPTPHLRPTYNKHKTPPPTAASHTYNFRPAAGTAYCGYPLPPVPSDRREPWDRALARRGSSSILVCTGAALT